MYRRRSFFVIGLTTFFIFLRLYVANKNHLNSVADDYIESTTSSRNFNFNSSAEDFNQLIDLSDFRFLINHRNCNEIQVQPTIVVMIVTAPKNFNNRVVVRETWGSKDPRALLIFLIGFVTDESLQKQIKIESDRHGDIIQGNFFDSYRNLTYKHVMAFKWFIYNCPDVPFLLKVDDDVFVNTPVLYDYLGASHQFLRNQLIFCYEYFNAKVKRTYRSKFRLSYEDYSAKYYPNYCEGCFVLYSADVLTQLYHQAQELSYFWIDDVHITGIVASSLNISILSAKGLILNYEEQSKLLRRQVKVENFPFISIRPPLNGEKIQETEFRKLWSLIKPEA